MIRVNKPKLILSILLVFLSFSLLAVTVRASGSLYAYTNSGYSSLCPTDSNAGGSWSVANGQTIYIQIAGITGISGSVEVRVGYTDDALVSHTATLGTFALKTLTSGAGSGTVGVGDAAAPISWVVGEFSDGTIFIPYCKTMVVQYRSAAGGPVIIADGTLAGAQSHLHQNYDVPESILGTAGALMSLAGAVGVFALVKRRKLSV